MPTQIKTECIRKSIVSDAKGIGKPVFYGLLVIAFIAIGLYAISFLNGVAGPSILGGLSWIYSQITTGQGVYIICLIVIGICALFWGVVPEDNGNLSKITESITMLVILTAMMYFFYFSASMSQKVGGGGLGMATGVDYPDVLVLTAIYLVVTTVVIILGRAYMRCRDVQ